MSTVQTNCSSNYLIMSHGIYEIAQGPGELLSTLSTFKSKILTVSFETEDGKQRHKAVEIDDYGLARLSEGDGLTLTARNIQDWIK